MFSLVMQTVCRRLIAVAVILALLAILAANPPSETRAFAVTIHVNSANDATDPEGCDDTHCSLREAITEANTNGFDTIIAFDLEFCPPACTISPQSPLPNVTEDGTVIDGTTEPEYVDTPIVTIDGSAQAFGVLRIAGLDITVRGLVVKNGPREGINIGPDSTFTIENNIVSTNEGRGIQATSGNGILSATIKDNTITGNGEDGIALQGENVVVSGNTVDSNQGNGIMSGLGKGTPAGQYFGNQVTNSGQRGIWASGAGVSSYDNTVVGSGDTGLLVVGDGVAAYNNTVTNSGGVGILAGSAGPGLVSISHNDVTNSGTALLVGQDAGIHLTLSGGTAAVIGNTVTESSGPGIQITGDDVLIGGTDPTDANSITGNGGSGVFLPFSEFAEYTGVSILGNSIYSNGLLAIDLQTAAEDAGDVTPNDDDDPDVGNNNLQNYPNLTAAVTGSLQLNGTLNSVANTDFRIEFFANDKCDPSGHGEGQDFLTALTVTTSGSGNIGFGVEIDENVPSGKFITSTATNQSTGDTSEFSECVEVTAPSTPTPTPTLAPGETPGPTPTPTPTPPPAGEPELTQGDNNCDGKIQASDALGALQYVAGLPVNQQPDCPTLGGALPAAAPASDPPALFGDVDCDDDVDAVDALSILQFVAALPFNQKEPCIDIGEPI